MPITSQRFPGLISFRKTEFEHCLKYQVHLLVYFYVDMIIIA